MSCSPSASLKECLAGLRASYYAGSKSSSGDWGDIIDAVLKGSDDIDDAEFHDTVQELKVEQKLLDAIEREDELLDPDIVAAKKALACTRLLAEKANLQQQQQKPHQPHAYPCLDTHKTLPAHPSLWPQAPLMVRPTPNTNMTIRGIRRASSTTYETFKGLCAGCILPVNNGTEAPGQSMVIDFESPCFIGTVLLRFSQASSISTTVAEQNYFEGKKRKFQAVVKGRFKEPLKMCDCVTGQAFDRPAGKLPPKWICVAAIKFVSTLAPQLDAQLDGHQPRFLAPLAATAHSILQQDAAAPKKNTNDMIRDLEADIQEPSSTDPTSILSTASKVLVADPSLDNKAEHSNNTTVSIPDTTKASIGKRMKTRKKILNAVTAQEDDRMEFTTDKEYTFEFYQHLIDFGADHFVDLGRPLGKIDIASITDGQPIKFMSAHKPKRQQQEQEPNNGNNNNKKKEQWNSLWSFDIWHAQLYPYAEMAAQDENTHNHNHN